MNASSRHRAVILSPLVQLVLAIEGRLFVVIYTSRSESIRIISARKANARERRLYEYQASEA